MLHVHLTALGAIDRLHREPMRIDDTRLGPP